jgi:hypothetical protein
MIKRCSYDVDIYLETDGDIDGRSLAAAIWLPEISGW